MQLVKLADAARPRAEKMVSDPASERKSSVAQPGQSCAYRLTIGAINLLASIHVVWFYVNRVPPHIQLLAYEQGRERTPFQYRLLMMYPMRWAHNSTTVAHIAHWLNSISGWFPNGVRPEGIIQAPIDLVCVAIAGIVARRLYQRSSPHGLLTPFVYPLTLVMIVGTYCLLNMHLLRFIYDLPSLAFFALGLEFICYHRNPAWLALLFIVATVNRETTIFLLLFYAVEYSMRSGRFKPRSLYAPAILRLVIPMLIFWLAWHRYVAQHYAANPTQAGSWAYLNIGLLIMPITWPQMFGAVGYVWLLVIVFRRDILDPVLRAWLSVTPLWLLLMGYYGILIETRLFGELIPLFACAGALICERRLIARLEAGPREFAPGFLR
jgi:hypothetical protein